MSVPLRKDELETAELTTADLAQGKRPAASEERPSKSLLQEDRPGPVLAERSGDKVRQDEIRQDEVRQDSTETRNTDVRNAVRSADARSANTLKNASGVATETTPLFPPKELEELRNRWSGVQTAFVDEPRRAVEQADSLVASAMKRLAEVFAEERSKLEKQWDRGDNVSTEDLRIALQRYRSFFDRLLAV